MENNKWDLTYIFKTDELWNESFDEAKELIKEIKKYEGKITKSLEGFKEFLKEKEIIDLKVEKLYMYAHLNHDVDTSVSKYQEMFSKIQSLYAKYYEYCSFIVTEMKDNKDKIEEYLSLIHI